jgi:hypothetical protein
MNIEEVVRIVRERQSIHGGLSSDWDMAEEWVRMSWRALKVGGTMSMGMPDGGRLTVEKSA